MTNDYGNLELHKVLLSAMKDIDKICRENGLRYYLHAGTLLGAVNHKGFIPWDDDVDISMFREDYEKFITLVQQIYPNRYFMQTYKTDIHYANNRAVLRILGTKLTHFHEDGNLEHSEIGVDVVPLDAAPDSRFLQRVQEWLIWTFDAAVQIKQGDIIPHHPVMRCIGLISKMNRVKLGKAIDKISMYYNRKNTRKIGLLTYTCVSPFNASKGYLDNIGPRYLYENPVDILFEDTYFMAISDPVVELNRRYPNWSEPYPEEKRVTKHDIQEYWISDVVRKGQEYEYFDPNSSADIWWGGEGFSKLCELPCRAWT